MDITKHMWRTVRYFVSAAGVDEVCWDAGQRVEALRCTCDAYKRQGGCVHVRYVRDSDYVDGVISMEMPADEFSDELRWREYQIASDRITCLD